MTRTRISPKEGATDSSDKGFLSSRYSGERVRRGLRHFMLGKGVSSGCNFLALVLTVRALPLRDFADYSVLVTLVDLATAFSSLGLAHVLLRYVPELYECRYRLSLRRLVGGAVGIRTAVLLALALLAHAWAPGFSQLIGIDSGSTVLSAFLVLVVLRSTAHFLSQVLESTLSQGLAQLGFLFAAVLRLAGLVWLLQRGDVRLIDVIYVEALAEGAGMLMMAGGILKVLLEPATAASASSAQDSSWLGMKLHTIVRFAAAGYVQQMIILLHGGSSNRLIAGRMLDTVGIASFGFAQSLVDTLQRYLPAQLLIGLIRPVIVARWARERRFGALAQLSSQVVLINVLLIVGAACILAVSGLEILQALSGGKYGSDALWVLVGLCLVLPLDTQRQQLAVLVQTVERYDLIPANALVASSVLVAIALLPALGVIAFPVANGVGLLLGNLWVLRRLRKNGFEYRPDWVGVGLVAACALAAVSAGALARVAGLHWALAAALAAAVYAALAWLLLGSCVRAFYDDLTGRAAPGMPSLAPEDAPLAGHPIHIAFGVLSSSKSARAVDEIARAVAPHQVIVHHDFSKEPDFRPGQHNVRVLHDPVSTALDDWSLVLAVQRLMRAALANPEVTHFQLLSETCLPVRPIEEFEAYLRRERPDVMIDMRSLYESPALLSHGWRYLSEPGWRRRVARLATVWTWQDAQHLKTHNFDMPPPTQADSALRRVQQWAGRHVLLVLASIQRRRLRTRGAPCLSIGSQWIGCSRRAMVWLLEVQSSFPRLAEHFQQCLVPNEAYIHTLVSSGLAAGVQLVVRPGNHVLFWDQCGTGPDLLSAGDLARVHDSGRHFARKFPLDAGSPVRSSVLRPLTTSDQ